MGRVQHCVLVLCALLLAACARTPEHEARVQEQQRYLEAAYHPQQYGVSVGQARWGLPAGTAEVLWRIPQGRSLAPLVVYLPGLGESYQGGTAWQQAWSEAGYAVLSIQTPEDGEALYQTTEARAGSFLGLARRAYAPEALVRRKQVVSQALQYLKLVIQSGDARFAAVDLNRVVLAGFDLGAQTAQALVGVSPVGGMPKVSALIAISPYAESSNVPEDFAAIKVPVLSISGPQDEDPFSWVSSPEVRLKLWQGVKTAGSCHLWLNGATHATLSGKAQDFMLAPSQPQAKGGHMPKRMDAGGGGPLGAFAGQEANGQQIAAVQAVSLAFLDMHLNQQASAKEWLYQKARAWLDGQGSLAFK